MCEKLMKLKQIKFKAFAAVTLGLCVLLTAVCGIISPGVSLAADEYDTPESILNDMVTVQFTEDESININNPERGWYSEFTTDDLGGMESLKAEGIDNVMILADLGLFKKSAISDSKLKEIRSAFARARKYGLSVIFRAAYDFEGVTEPEPKDISVIKNHIAQLKPIFTENEDILFCVQAGFLGPWGEWHTSYYGDPPSLSARTTVLTALMNAVPKSRQIEIRRPMFIRDMYPKQTLTASNAFNQSNFARTGYHDDALLSTEDENGTYVDPDYNRADELDWADNHDKYTPCVGESDELSSYSDPDNAVYEMGKLHMQILNSEYLPEVLDKWKNTAYKGENTYDYISRYLGYRFVLSSSSVNSSIAQGGAMHLVLKFQNTGFANLINARDFKIVLSNGKETYTAAVNDDARFWTKARGVITEDLYFSIPSDIQSGAWKIYVNMPNMSNNPLYSIRFANKDTWVASKGYNLIGTATIDSTLPNSVSSFKQISKEDAQTLYMSPPSISASPLSYKSIKLSWDTVDGVTGYKLYRATSRTGLYKRIVISDSTSYTDSGVLTGKTYYYKLRAYILSGSTYIHGPYSDIVSAKTVLGVPQSVKASPQTYNKIKITWGAVAGRTKYRLYRATSESGPYTRIETTSYTYYTDKSVKTGTTYYYMVRAYRLVSHKNVYGGYSEIVSAHTTLGIPSSVKAVRYTSTSIKVSWGSVAGATKYEIWNADTDTLITATGSKYYIGKGLVTGSIYRYKVRAYRLSGKVKIYSDFTEIVEIKL